MPLTLRDLVYQAQGHLEQFLVNQSKTGTFVAWQTDGSGAKIAPQLTDVHGGDLTNALVELVTGELVYVRSHDTAAGTTTSPAWFRAQKGTPQLDTVAANSKVVVNPLWPTFHVARAVCNGIEAVYPKLFGVAEATLTSTFATPNYDISAFSPAAEGILNLNIETPGPELRQVPIRSYKLDTVNAASKRFLRLGGVVVSPDRPIYVTYKAKPVVPDIQVAGGLDATWASTLLPTSAADLPVLHAVATLVATVDAAKLQMSSLPQSDQNRLVQGGSASATSRRFREMFEERLSVERQKLMDRFPPRMHKEMG